MPDWIALAVGLPIALCLVAFVVFTLYIGRAAHRPPAPGRVDRIDEWRFVATDYQGPPSGASWVAYGVGDPLPFVLKAILMQRLGRVVNGPITAELLDEIARHFAAHADALERGVLLGTRSNPDQVQRVLAARECTRTAERTLLVRVTVYP